MAVGDVDIELENESQGLIKNIHHRKIISPGNLPRQKHQLHLLAANADQAMLVITLIQPMLKPGFVDRFLLMTEPQNIIYMIVVNKYLFTEMKVII